MALAIIVAIFDFKTTIFIEPVNKIIETTITSKQKTASEYGDGI